ncbi:MAG: hypothetical protein NTX50_15300 [Candidatus Sumerlaeota bacterium]|nr:hypothetical protein [Candidatus Sumerlaeota bacterium]
MNSSDPQPIKSVTASAQSVDENAKPSFCWDRDWTIGKIRRRLREGDEYERDSVASWILREGTCDEVWLFFTPGQVERMLPRIKNHLGRRADFWLYILTSWRQLGLMDWQDGEAGRDSDKDEDKANSLRSLCGQSDDALPNISRALSPLAEEFIAKFYPADYDLQIEKESLRLFMRKDGQSSSYFSMQSMKPMDGEILNPCVQGTAERLNARFRSLRRVPDFWCFHLERGAEEITVDLSYTGPATNHLS